MVPKAELVQSICASYDIKSDLIKMNQKDLLIVLNTKPKHNPVPSKTKNESVAELQKAFPSVDSFDRASAQALQELIRGINGK